MPSLYVEVEIDAPRSVVWESLIRKDKWSYWNTFLLDRDPENPFEKGKRLLIAQRRLAKERETEFQVLVTAFQPGVCLRWVCQAPGFRSEQVFELQDVGFRRTQYRHLEILAGTLAPIVLPFIRRDEQRGLNRMAAELKYYAEHRAY
ncbi:MAG: SRPBCC domain-containing protein [Synechococcales bacterium]|nr:SRPBCC domain-containing protein [Synechococcales bacterium]